MVYKIKNRLGGFKYETISNQQITTKKPIIFAVSHIGKFDIEVVSEAIKSHYYLLSGDYEHLQGTVDSQFLSLNGVIYFNEKVKWDRQSVQQRMIDLLRQGGNLMYFPEGTWNLTPNLPMLPCYWGIVDIAKQGKAIIVPIACEQYGKFFKINIGKNFDMSEYGDKPIDKTTAIINLRDTLSTLKYEIWESNGIKKRKEIEPNECQRYIDTRLKEWPYFTENYIDNMIFKPKGIIQSEEAFSHLGNITPNINNAFLFCKRLNG